MGAGASVDSTSSLCRDLKDLKTKPVDCSDVEDSLEKSLAELGKLRQILQQIDIDKLQEIVHNAEFQSSILEADSASSADLDYATKLLNQIKLKMGERFKSLRKTFLAIDQDNSGFISRQEFKDSCAEWGVMIDDEDCESLDKLYPHQEADSAEDKGINYLEFIAMMTKQVMYEVGEGESATKVDDELRRKVLNGHDTMKRAFNRADIDHSGSLNKTELKAIVDYYQIECTDAEFTEFFKAYDVNGDGQFSYNEFVKLLQSQPQLTN